jgi:ribonuclease HI
MEVYADGSRSTSGGIKWAYIVLDDGKIVHSASGTRSSGSSNFAEYMAVTNALEWIVRMCSGREVTLYTDSELVLNQVSGKYRCRSKHLRPWRDVLVSLLESSGRMGVVVHLRKVSSKDNLAHSVLDTCSTLSPVVVSMIEDSEIRAYTQDVNEWEGSY